MKALTAWRKDALSPPDLQYVGVCDGIRCLAVGIVAWFHIWQQSWLWPGLTIGAHQVNLDPIVRAGYMGVDLMILLSGFCLYLPWARLSPNAPAPSCALFYRKRAARIFPSYYLSVVLLLMAALLENSYVGNAERMLRDVFAHLTFTHVFFYDTYYATHLNAGLWTIAVEVHFYLLFPLIARCFRRRPLLTPALMILTAMLFRQTVAVKILDIGVYFNQLIAFLDVFALGMLAAHLYVRSAHLSRGGFARIACDFLAIVAWIGILRLFRAQAGSSGTEAIRLGQMERRFALGLWGAVFLLAAANGGLLLRKLLGNRITHFLASVSMQFYIWHQVLAVRILRSGLIPSAYAEPNYMGDTVWQKRFTAACWLISLAWAVLLTYGFEKPIARWILRRKYDEKHGKR